jgi:hypothetical protein
MATAVFALEPGAGLADEAVSGCVVVIVSVLAVSAAVAIVISIWIAAFADHFFGSRHAPISLFEHDLFGKTGSYPRIKSEGMLFRITLWTS